MRKTFMELLQCYFANWHATCNIHMPQSLRCNRGRNRRALPHQAAQVYQPGFVSRVVRNSDPILRTRVRAEQEERQRRERISKRRGTSRGQSAAVASPAS